jgi:hypothetical protein
MTPGPEMRSLDEASELREAERVRRAYQNRGYDQCRFAYASFQHGDVSS